MNRFLTRTVSVALLVGILLPEMGCRAIGRFSESRQTIASRRLSRQGLKAMHEGDWTVAESLFADALDVSENDDRAHWGLAESLWQRGERTAAIVHMEQAVRLSAGDPKLVQRLGRMYLDVGRLEDAIAQSNLAMAAERESAEVWALHGDCLLNKGQLDEALAAYHRALALQPDFPTVQLQAAEIYQSQGRFDRLVATLDRLEEGTGSDETPARADMLRGIAMQQLGKPVEATRCFALAASKSPDDPAPHLHLAALAMDRGEIEQARLALARAVELDPTSAQSPLWVRKLGETPQLADELPRQPQTEGKFR